MAEPPGGGGPFLDNYDLTKAKISQQHIESQLDSLSLDGDVSVDDGAMARATDWLRGAEQRHAEGAEAEAPHVELAIESE